VDAATKAGPMRELIERVQQNAAAAMATPSVLHPCVCGVPTPGALAGTCFLAGNTEPGKLPEALTAGALKGGGGRAEVQQLRKGSMSDEQRVAAKQRDRGG
jgi:hypothetical protein